MSRLYHATGTGWYDKAAPPPPVTDPGSWRLTAILSTTESGNPTPQPSATVFGYNANAPEGDFMVQQFGTLPICRCYRGTATLPSNGSDFQPGGYAYTSARVGQLGALSGKRINMSVLFDPATITNASSPKAVELRNYAASVPAGWEVQIVLYHEYNLHTTDGGGDGKTGRTMAQFVNAQIILANAIADGDNGNGRCFAVINPSWGNGVFQSTHAPHASDMPPGSQFHWDVYDNPNGYPSGYKQYGTVPRGKNALTGAMNMLATLGYMDPAYGWGVDEFNSPRRVAPKLATLNSTYGWGPLSPYDISGDLQAQKITEMTNYFLSFSVKPTTLIIFSGTGAWNQSFRTAGTADRDAPAGDPLHQGWPLQVDPSKTIAAWKSFIDISA